jgi:hypothetical protein
LRVESKLGSNNFLTIIKIEKSIANKYREGKLKRTPKGELKDLKLLLWNHLNGISNKMLAIILLETCSSTGFDFKCSYGHKYCLNDPS